MNIIRKIVLVNKVLNVVKAVKEAFNTANDSETYKQICEEINAVISSLKKLSGLTPEAKELIDELFYGVKKALK